MKNMIPRLVLGGIAAVGMLLLWLGCSLHSKARASEGWPTVDGKVIGCTVVEKTERDEDGNTSILYSADIVYEYKLDGRSYKSSKVSHVRTSSSSSKEAEDTARRYSIGKTVQVHYNPDDPSEAVLETHTSGGSAFVFLFAAVLLIVGVGGLAFTFRRTPSRVMASSARPRRSRVLRASSAGRGTPVRPRAFYRT